MYKCSKTSHIVVFVLAYSWFFAVILYGIYEWKDHGSTSFSTIEGIALSLYFMCVYHFIYLRDKINGLDKEITELKKTIDMLKNNK